MHLRNYTLSILMVASLHCAQAQFNWSVVLGGGISDLEIPMNKDEYHELLTSELLLEVGTTISGTFRKEGMLGWQMGLILQNSGFSSIPIDREKVKEIYGDGPVNITDKMRWPRDHDQTYRKRNWLVNAPVSLKFNVFSPVSLIFGADFNYLLTDFREEDIIKINTRGDLDPQFKDFNIGGHIGIYVPIGDLIQIDGRIFSDMKPRLNYFRKGTETLERGYRRLGFSVNVSYQLN